MGAKVRALIVGGERIAHADAGTTVDVVLDRTPFYAESGGQVGDTGTITTPAGAQVRVLDTQYGLPGLVVHRATVEQGTIAEGDEVDRRRSTPCAATRSGATTPRPTCCTGRCARCSART